MTSRRRVLGLALGAPLGLLAAATVTGGAALGVGPLAMLRVLRMRVRDDPRRRSGEIVFYGASNFTLWFSIADDLARFRVVNHAFGGSTDADLRRWAGLLLLPYDPAIVVLQTGSNDYAGLSGTLEEQVDRVLREKRAMLAAWCAALPRTRFVVLSGLLLPGRASFVGLTRALNAGLARLADEMPTVTYVDAEALTLRGGRPDPSLFIRDGIHLTGAARRRWADEFIAPVLDRLIAEHDLHSALK
jgi:lysophospholipase L1-like esterase